MHARWIIFMLVAGILGLGQMGASNSQAVEEESTVAPTPDAPAPSAPAADAPVPTAQASTPSIRGEADAVESRVGGSQPPLLSSSWWGAVQQAERWKFAGDMALLNKQWTTAYPFYDKVARTFPGTPHGRAAASRGNYALYRLRHAGDYPPEEDDLREIYDLLTW